MNTNTLILSVGLFWIIGWAVTTSAMFLTVGNTLEAERRPGVWWLWVLYCVLFVLCWPVALAIILDDRRRRRHGKR
jgi:hypothetical protein